MIKGQTWLAKMCGIMNERCFSVIRCADTVYSRADVGFNIHFGLQGWDIRLCNVLACIPLYFLMVRLHMTLCTWYQYLHFVQLNNRHIRSMKIIPRCPYILFSREEHYTLYYHCVRGSTKYKVLRMYVYTTYVYTTL